MDNIVHCKPDYICGLLCRHLVREENGFSLAGKQKVLETLKVAYEVSVLSLLII